MRVTKSQGGFPLPLSGVQVETLHLTEPVDIPETAETLYLCLDGEVVLDFGLEFAHLRSQETFTVSVAHRLSPVGIAVLLRARAA